MKFKASHPAFDPPQKIKDQREETFRVFTRIFGLTPKTVDTLRIMTETFFKAGMNRTAQLEKMVQRGEMNKQDFIDMLNSLKGGEEDHGSN